MQVTAIIGDIIASREIQERSAFQQQLSSKLAELSRNTNIISPYTITLGDEFQALYQSSSQIFLDLLKIKAHIWPIRCRFAIGIGRIDTAINRKSAIGMDGPAFHLARAGIDALKKNHGYFLVQSEKANSLQALLNDSLSLFTSQLREWPETRLKILLAIAQQEAVADIAKDLGTSPQAVYKSIRSGELKTILSLLNNIEHVMESHLK